MLPRAVLCIAPTFLPCLASLPRRRATTSPAATVWFKQVQNFKDQTSDALGICGSNINSLHASSICWYRSGSCRRSFKSSTTVRPSVRKVQFIVSFFILGAPGGSRTLSLHLCRVSLPTVQVPMQSWWTERGSNPSARPPSSLDPAHKLWRGRRDSNPRDISLDRRVRKAAPPRPQTPKLGGDDGI